MSSALIRPDVLLPNLVANPCFRRTIARTVTLRQAWALKGKGVQQVLGALDTALRDGDATSPEERPASARRREAGGVQA